MGQLADIDFNPTVMADPMGASETKVVLEQGAVNLGIPIFVGS